MDLKSFLDKNRLSQEDFGKRFAPPVSQGLVWQWLEWLKNPKKGTRITAERAIEIETVTAGQVARHELRPDLFPKEKAA